MLERVQASSPPRGRQVVPVCAAIEAEIAQLDEADRAEFLATWARGAGPQPRDPRRLRLLGLQTYFTAGVKEVRAWTVRRAPPRRRPRA
jgi:ribosome-binding ATPase YchF (GTP1/OBG family)